MSENPQLYSEDVVATIQQDAYTINYIASVVGVSALAIAAPIARELNKTEVGDYWLGNLFAPIKDLVVNYQIVGLDPNGLPMYGPITNDYIAADYDYVMANDISNLGISGDWNRINNVVLNDIGPGKSQIGTAITLLNDYVNNPQYTSDPLAADAIECACAKPRCEHHGTRAPISHAGCRSGFLPVLGH